METIWTAHRSYGGALAAERFRAEELADELTGVNQIPPLRGPTRSRMIYGTDRSIVVPAGPAAQPGQFLRRTAERCMDIIA